jgi:hypothetical protein
MITFIAAVAAMDQDEEDLRRKKERAIEMKLKILLARTTRSYSSTVALLAKKC